MTASTSGRILTIAAVLLASVFQMVGPPAPLVGAEADLTDLSGPSVSGDGRWVVYTATTDGRRSAFRTDLFTDATVELSTVPEGVRPGDTVGARISADGCVVVATSQLPFDLFRDDDRHERWDVYRLVVPECGGRPNEWELLSTDGFTGVSRDDVDPTDPAAVSASGALVAFTHPLGDPDDGLTTVTLVDATVPTGQIGRLNELPGVPTEAPNRAYVYRGARQPAISHDGRQVAFVADFTASEPLPGWGDGPQPGSSATAQVFVWDRTGGDLRPLVHLVSGRDGVPSRAGASSPSLSEDGRIVAFVSADRSLVPAVLPDCAPICPTQVFRYDRDPDGNGWFDEPGRLDALSIVSATRSRFRLPVAGNASSWAPVVVADGSQVAFVTDATNLLATRRGGGGEATDGDLLVAEHRLGTVRRVLDDVSLAGVPGAHGRPALSRSGSTVVFDTMVTGPITRLPVAAGGRTVGVARTTPRVSLAAIDFGTVFPGVQSPELYATVRNAGPGGFELGGLSVSPGFGVTGGSCIPGVVVPAGMSCSIELSFTPLLPRPYSGTLEVTGADSGAPTVRATVSGTGGRPTVLAQPGGLDLPDGIVGRPGGRVAIDIENTGFAPTVVETVELAGAEPGDFAVIGERCTGRFLNPGATCAVEIEFRPTTAGFRSALLIARTGDVDPATAGAYTSAVLGGWAGYEPTLSIEGSLLVEPGDEIGVEGAGFPAGSRISIGFADGVRPFTTTTAGPDGSVLALVRLPSRLPPGNRILVATAGDGAVATVPIRVVGHAVSTVPGLPGYGSG